MQKVTLEVGGMTCAHCEKAVQNALIDLGVDTVKASAGEKTVEVSFSPVTVTLEDIKKEIKEMGYNV